MGLDGKREEKDVARAEAGETEIQKLGRLGRDAVEKGLFTKLGADPHSAFMEELRGLSFAQIKQMSTDQFLTAKGPSLSAGFTNGCVDVVLVNTGKEMLGVALDQRNDMTKKCP